MSGTTGGSPNVNTLCFQGELDRLIAFLAFLSAGGSQHRTLDEINVILNSSKDDEGRAALHHCVYPNTPESNKCLDYILSNFKPEIGVKDKQGIAPLHIAAFRNNLEALKLLIEKGAEPDVRDHSNETPLHKAALNGNTECLLFLLEKGAEIAPRNISNSTPLHYAAINGHLDCISALVLRNSSIDSVNTEGSSSLHYALFSGNLDCTKLLSDRGGNTLAHLKDLNGFTSLHYACCSGNWECIDFVLSKGVDLNQADSDGITPLHILCTYGFDECLVKMIEQCPTLSFDCRDNNGETALHKASANGHTKCIQVLLEKGLSPEVQTFSDHTTPLHFACFGGFPDSVRLLIDHVSSVDQVDSEGATALHKSAFRGDENCTKMLVEKGANVKACDVNMSTPLHKAAWSGNAKVVNLLLEHGCLVDAKDLEGGTPLFNAVFNGHASCVRTLIQNGADTNIVDAKGYTALHIAATSNALDCCQALVLEGKAELNCKTATGKTPLIIALLGNHLEVSRFLLRQGAEYPPLEDSVKAQSPPPSPSNSSVDSEHLGNSANSGRHRFDVNILKQLLRERSDSQCVNDEMDEEQEKLWKTGIQMFNSSPKKGVAYLVSVGLLGSSPKEIASFLIKRDELSKKAIGDYLGEEAYIPVLDEFVLAMDFSNLEFDVALRRFLSKFRLPGEAQKIDRIMERFAQQYFTHNPAGNIFANSDTVYLLAFATIMLNTDAHSPQIKKKMTKAEFINNTKTINNGTALPREFMEVLYDKIIYDEIKMETEGKMWTNAEKKGWLTKQEGGSIKTWKRRWFILDNNCLYYFRTPQDVEPCGIIPLENLLVTRADNKKKNCLMITDPSGRAIKSARIASDGSVVKGNDLSFYVATQSAEEAESWLNAINTNIHRNPFYDLLRSKQKANSSGPDRMRERSKSVI